MKKEFLFELLSTPSVSGDELALEKKIYDYIKPYADEVRTDEIGDVIAVLNPESPCRVLLCGHADEIGLMVTAVTEKGFLKVTKIGGIYPSSYLGQKVRVMTETGIIYGSVVMTRDLSKKAELSPEDLTIDIGAKNKEEALKVVSLGDTITFDTDYRELLNDCINGRALDDRTGAFIVMEAVRRAKEKGCKVGVYGAATVGEETTMNGAYFVAERVRPTLGIAVDVTYTSDYPGTDEAATGDIRVGAGPVLVNNPACHKKLQKLLREAAKRCKIAVQIEAANGRTGTDGDTIHKSGQGVPVTLVSIPLRYMHTPAEMGSLKDMEECIELLAEFLCGLEEKVELGWF
jgi:endoglucanase